MSALTIDRAELKTHYKELIDYIQKRHVMEPVIEQELFVHNEPVPNLCHTRGYFVMFGEYHIQYLMDHVIMDVDLRLIGRSVEQVIFYDTYAEYEAARVRAMSGVKPSEQTGLNLN